MLYSKRRLLFVVTEDWYFVSHRLALAVEASRAGFNVMVATRFSSHRRAIEDAGLRVIPFEMNRRGLNPLALLREAVGLADILRRERPDVVHLVALRPVVVGGLAVRLAGIRRIVSAVSKSIWSMAMATGRMPKNPAMMPGSAASCWGARIINRAEA